MDPQLLGVGGLGVKGRIYGRIIEIERDRRGRVKRSFRPVGLFWWAVALLFRRPWGLTWEQHVRPVRVKRVVEDNIPVYPNGATTQGMNHVLDVAFRNQAQTATWYATIINNAAYSAVAVGDTAASHAGWAEWTGYNEAVRQTWSPAAASAGSIANTSAMTFTNNSGSTVTIRGVAIYSVNTKGATTGLLWATAIESSGRALSDTQAFQVIYQVDLSPTS